MLPFGDVVHADVQLGAAGQGTGDFFTQEEVGVTLEVRDGTDRVVIGDGHQLHAHTLQTVIDGFGFTITFPAEAPGNRDRAHAGVDRMNVEIALHAPVISDCSYSQVTCGKNIRE